MNKNTQITAAALIVAATTGFAAAGSLELDRAYASELKADAGTRSVLNENNLSNMVVSVGVRFGYSINVRDDNGTVLGDSDTTIGFQTTEAEVALEGDVTDNMHARLSFDFGPDNTDSLSTTEGTANLEDAYVDWAVNDDFTLRVGQYIPSYSAEASTSEFHMMNAFRSVTHEFLGTPSWTQGVEAQFAGDTWSFAIGVNDGPNTGSSAFTGSVGSGAGVEADFGFNARFDIYSDSDKARFDDQTSWRGSANGWRLGAGVIFATYGNTNPAAPASESDNFWFTVDGAYEGDGWALTAAFYGNNIDPNAAGSQSYNNYGFEVGGSVFLSDQWEAFGRYDILILDDQVGAGQVTVGQDDTQSFISAGVNYYFVPESHAAKFTLDFGIALDQTADILNTTGDTGVTPFGSLTGGTAGSTGFLTDAANSDGQFMVSAIMQWLF